MYGPTSELVTYVTETRFYRNMLRGQLRGHFGQHGTLAERAPTARTKRSQTDALMDDGRPVFPLGKQSLQGCGRGN